MQRTSLAVIMALIVGASAIAAVAVGPTALRNLSGPGSNTNNPGNGGAGPNPTSFDAPTWQPGDTWTYDVNSSYGGIGTDGPSATGSLTRTVVSADASQVNVSLDGSFHIRWMVDPTPVASDRDAAAMMMCSGMLENATLSGYTWYRASDLALIKEVRSVTVRGSAMTSAGMYAASYVATLETTFEPALDVWSFPLQANESWTAASNATVQGWIRWSLVGPNGSWATGTNFTYSEPVRLSLMSGEGLDVSTPAGTFPSIPVSMGHPELDYTRPGIAMEPRDRAIGLDHEVPVGRDHAAQSWYSGTAKNVVKAQLFAAGMRLTLVLSSYHVG